MEGFAKDSTVAFLASIALFSIPSGRKNEEGKETRLLEWEDAKEIEIDTVDNESVLRLPGISFRTARPSGTGSNFKSKRDFKQSIKSYASYKKSLAEYKGINKQSILLSKSGK